MKDEEYVFRQDVKEKASTGRSARNRRTHCGKGGRVKLPSDYMTKKELNAMSGECKSYRLNEPMSWKEFLRLPNDIKESYVKLIREKFGASDRAIATMLEISPSAFSQELKRCGIDSAKTKGRPRWDKEGFLMWAHGVPVEQASLPSDSLEDTESPAEEVEVELTEQPIEDAKEAVCIPPLNGQLTFEGNVDEICNTIRALLKDAKIKMYMKWSLVDGD